MRVCNLLRKLTVAAWTVFLLVCAQGQDAPVRGGIAATEAPEGQEHAAHLHGGNERAYQEDQQPADAGSTPQYYYVSDPSDALERYYALYGSDIPLTSNGGPTQPSHLETAESRHLSTEQQASADFQGHAPESSAGSAAGGDAELDMLTMYYRLYGSDFPGAPDLQPSEDGHYEEGVDADSEASQGEWQGEEYGPYSYAAASSSSHDAANSYPADDQHVFPEDGYVYDGGDSSDEAGTDYGSALADSVAATSLDTPDVGYTDHSSSMYDNGDLVHGVQHATESNEVPSAGDTDYAAWSELPQQADENNSHSDGDGATHVHGSSGGCGCGKNYGDPSDDITCSDPSSNEFRQDSDRRRDESQHDYHTDGSSASEPLNEEIHYPDPEELEQYILFAASEGKAPLVNSGPVGSSAHAEAAGPTTGPACDLDAVPAAGSGRAAEVAAARGPETEAPRADRSYPDTEAPGGHLAEAEPVAGGYEAAAVHTYPHEDVAADPEATTPDAHGQQPQSRDTHAHEAVTADPEAAFWDTYAQGAVAADTQPASLDTSMQEAFAADPLLASWEHYAQDANAADAAAASWETNAQVAVTADAEAASWDANTQEPVADVPEARAPDPAASSWDAYAQEPVADVPEPAAWDTYAPEAGVVDTEAASVARVSVAGDPAAASWDAYAQEAVAADPEAAPWNTGLHRQVTADHEVAAYELHVQEAVSAGAGAGIDDAYATLAEPFVPEARSGLEAEVAAAETYVHDSLTADGLMNMEASNSGYGAEATAAEQYVQNAAMADGIMSDMATAGGSRHDSAAAEHYVREAALADGLAMDAGLLDADASQRDAPAVHTEATGGAPGRLATSDAFPTGASEMGAEASPSALDVSLAPEATDGGVSAHAEAMAHAAGDVEPGGAAAEAGALSNAEAASASSPATEATAEAGATAVAGGGAQGSEANLDAEGSPTASLPVALAPPEEPEPQPLGNYTEQDVEKMIGDYRAFVYANTTVRNVSAGVAGLQRLHELVEAALPREPRKRTTLVTQPLPQVLGTGNGGEAEGAAAGAGNASTAVAQQQQQAPAAPPQRSLSVEVSTNRNNGLHAAAAATFQLAALQASGVVPGPLLPADPAAGPGTAAVLAALHQAARAGSLEALMSLADRHAQGLGTEANCWRGLTFAKLAAQHLVLEVEKEQRFAAPLAPVSLRDRFADGSYVAAEDAENGEDVISLEEDMALRGSADAQRRMAYRRLVGRGMDADPEGAFHDFQAAAAQGDPYAIFNVGYMYLRGLHVPQNHTIAKEYFEQAAEKGLPSAYNGLGVLAWNGQGQPQNLTAAREAFEKGAALNNSDSLYNLGVMHYHGTGTPVNHTLAVELLKRAHAQGHWRAPYLLAHAHEAGAGTPADCPAALNCIRSFFADRADWGPQLTAAVRLLDAGDTWGALLSYITLAEQGSTAAAANAAWLLRRKGVVQGPGAEALAAKYFQRAAKQGHTGSMIELAHMLLAAAPPTEPAQDGQGSAHPPSTAPSNLHSVDDAQAPEVPAAPVQTDAPHSADSPLPSTALSTTTAGESNTPAAEAAEASHATSVDVAANGANSEPFNSAETAPASSEQDSSANTINTVEHSEQDSSPNTAAATDDTITTASQDTSPPAPPASNSSSSTNTTASGPTPLDPEPLVPPAPIPKGRAALGVAGVAEAVAWYRAAAAAGDPEGVYYLGWLHYRGLGVPANATRAQALWMRALDSVGIKSPKALAPLLALAGARLDRWVAPLLGPHALARLGVRAGQAHAALMERARSWELVRLAEEAFLRDGRVRGAVGHGAVVGEVLSGDRHAGMGAPAEGASLENVVMGALFVALGAVLAVRRRRLARRAG